MHEMKESTLNFVRADMAIGTTTKDLRSTVPASAKKFDILTSSVFAFESEETFGVVSLVPQLNKAIKSSSDEDMLDHRVLLHSADASGVAGILSSHSVSACATSTGLSQIVELDNSIFLSC